MFLVMTSWNNEGSPKDLILLTKIRKEAEDQFIDTCEQEIGCTLTAKEKSRFLERIENRGKRNIKNLSLPKAVVIYCTILTLVFLV